MSAPGIIIAAPASGSGKTTVTLGLMRAFLRRGRTVQPFKCGPDYIDPAFHTVAAGRASHNLDTWAMRRTVIDAIVSRESADATLSIAEGVMGLFDGVAEPGQTSHASTADLAALTGWPVVLVLDVSAQAETAAAVALGCARYRPDVSIAGVILNRVAGDAHARMITPALSRIGLTCFGALPRRADLALPERHLGLVQATETGDLDERLDRIADAVASAVDLDAILSTARSTQRSAAAADVSVIAPPGQRVALAHDAAFAFTYPHIVAGWRRAGAEVIPFSPLADEAPDRDADAVWLPGGYPELHAAKLAARFDLWAALRAHAAAGKPLLAECGGMMSLFERVVDKAGEPYAFAGLLPGAAVMQKRLAALGLQEVDLPEGRLSGHTFHYSQSATPLAPLVRARTPEGREGEAIYRQGRLTASYVHFYFPGNPAAVAALLG
jgi:cobyrinic acid a,c-diamide synthase